MDLSTVSSSPVDDSDRQALVQDGMLRIHEAADFLKISRSKVYQLMEQGLLCYCKIGKARRIPRQAVIDLATRSLIGGVAA